MTHDCIYKDKIDKIGAKQEEIGVDVAIIKNALVGNGSEGYLKKTDRHEKYWQMMAGGMGLVSFALMIAKVLR